MTDAQSISIHALLAESDRFFARIAKRALDFYPRSPCGERPLANKAPFEKFEDFYPRSPCGERLQGFLLARGHRSHFYPRSPCGERQTHLQQDYTTRLFLSTLSLRRATNGIRLIVHIGGFLSTLSLRRATARRASRQQPAGISIHALLAESDPDFRRYIGSNIPFLSTLSLRRATIDDLIS